MKDAPLSYLFRKASIKTENQLMALSDSIWKYCPYTDRKTGAYIFFSRGGKLYHGTHVPGPVAQLGAESEYNSACTTGIYLSYFRILIHELLSKNPGIVPEEDPLIILDIRSNFFMDDNGKDTTHTRHISIRVHSGSNGEKCKIQNINLSEGSRQLSDIANNSFG